MGRKIETFQNSKHAKKRAELAKKVVYQKRNQKRNSSLQACAPKRVRVDLFAAHVYSYCFHM